MTSALASPPDAAFDAQHLGTLIVFRLGDQSYALPLACVREVLPMAELSRPPQLPRILEGFLNLAGQAVPVVRLERLFGLADGQQPPVCGQHSSREPVPELYTPLLIVAIRRRLVALLVEKVTETVSATAAEIVPLEKGHSFNGCARGIVRKGECMMLLLRPERIFIEGEMRCLKEYQAMEQQRLEAIGNQVGGDQGPRSAVADS
jgi:purine-binding chemotaxis protein CheW